MIYRENKKYNIKLSDSEKLILRLKKKYGIEERYNSLNKYRWNYVDICMWYKDAGDLINGPPTIKYFRNRDNIFNFKTKEDRIMFMQLHYHIPEGFNRYFKSPEHAYRMANEFYEMGKKNVYGYTCLSKDGHKCNSLMEAKIDDYLYQKNIYHEKEPYYPRSKWRADFKVDNYYIEYFGLTGNAEYDNKTINKILYAKEHNINIIEIYPTDDDKTWKNKINSIIKSKEKI